MSREYSLLKAALSTNRNAAFTSAKRGFVGLLVKKNGKLRILLFAAKS
jgi:hypothetical protein